MVPFEEDSMMMGNSIIAAARKEAANSGYTRQTNLQMGMPINSGGMGGLPGLQQYPNKRQVGHLPPI